MDRRTYLAKELGRYPSLASLRRSAFYSECGAEIERLLSTPELFTCDKALPRLSSFVRVTQWNLEKGKNLPAVIRYFESHEVLQWADVVMLNEVDCGMIRSGNLHVARCLGAALGMHVAFAPACLELTKGIHDEELLAGENSESTQGNAVLSRHPILEAHVVRLPQCFEPYEFHEKRYGGRNCLWVRIRIGTGTLWAGSTHLEVRNTPGCRAIQMKRLMKDLPGTPGEAHLLGGDMNTNCLRRGTRWRALSAAAFLLLSDPQRVEATLLTPQTIEPLFRVAALAAFTPQGLNPAEATACVQVETSEDARMVPGILRGFLQRRAEPYRDGLMMKLDWFLGRAVHPLRAGEVCDGASGVASSDPVCVPTVHSGPTRISDHRPICADIALPWQNAHVAPGRSSWRNYVSLQL